MKLCQLITPEKFKNANKKLLIIKNGDHSLSSKKNLKKITIELNSIISNFI